MVQVKSVLPRRWEQFLVGVEVGMISAALTGFSCPIAFFWAGHQKRARENSYLNAMVPVGTQSMIKWYIQIGHSGLGPVIAHSRRRRVNSLDAT